MLRYLLDSNICIDVIKRRPESLLERFNRNAGHLAISSITLAELMHGAEKSSDPERSLAVVEDFCSRLELLAYGAKAAQHYGQICAAHARSEGLTLVSNNLHEFERVEGLLYENWV